MILVILGLTWCYLADSPSQLILLAIAILLRVLYVTGKYPVLPRDLFIYWIAILTLGYFVFSADLKEDLLMIFLSLALLGTLILHIGQQTANSGIVHRIPIAQHVALFFGRYMMLGKREIDDMNFWSQQNVRSIRVRNADRSWIVRSFSVSRAYLESRIKIAICLFHNARALVERWDAILSARGGLPSYELAMLTARRAPRIWYADVIADIGLALLLLLPLGMGNDMLIPQPILGLAHSIVTGVEL